MKFTPENVRKQQELAKNQNADRIPKSGRSTQNKPKGSSGLFNNSHSLYLTSLVVLTSFRLLPINFHLCCLFWIGGRNLV